MLDTELKSKVAGAKEDGLLSPTGSEGRIGYYIGAFPGPTYFWREIRSLRQLGLEVDPIATRPAQEGFTPHPWVEEARQQTDYILPFDLRSFLRVLSFLLKAGPTRWLACVKAILKADGVTFKERLRLAAMILPAVRLAEMGAQKGWRHIHIGFCSDAANVALLAKLLGGPSYSLTLHSTLKDFGSNQRQKWGQAAFGTAVAPNLAAELHEHLEGCLPQFLQVVTMGVDTQQFKRSQPYQPWQPTDGPVRLLCIARFTPRKGQQDLIQAMALLRDRGIESRLQLIGSDQDPAKWFAGELQKLMHNLQLTDWVTMQDEIPEDQVRQAMEAAHLFVLPSYAEGTSVAVMEAMAMQVPVIATNVDGMPNLITDGIDGLLVKPGEPAQLAERIYDLLNQPDLAVTLTRNSRIKIEQRFGCDQSAKVLLQGLRNVN